MTWVCVVSILFCRCFICVSTCVCVCLCHSQTFQWAPLSITDGGHEGQPIVPGGRGCVRRRWEEGRSAVVECFSLVACLCTEQRGFEREIMWLGSKGKGYLLFCVGSWLRTGHFKSHKPQRAAAANEALQLAQGHQRQREANMDTCACIARTNGRHRSPSRCAQGWQTESKSRRTTRWN